MKKRCLSLLLICLLLLPTLVGCDKDGVKMLSFAQTHSLKELNRYDGKRVSIVGYMSTLSPLSGEFMYLMNLPYQSCPYCVPNTNQLSNTIAVYAKSADGFKFTDRAILVEGTLEFGLFEDEFGYEYYYRIADATYSILDTEDMSEELKLWQQLASTDVIADVYEMLDYVDFLCRWPSYTATGAGGKQYLSPGNALYLLETEGAQYNYGMKDGYFDALCASIKEVDETAFEDLIRIVNDAKALSETAYAELKNGRYETTAEYDKVFGDGRTQYRLTDSETLKTRMNELYTAFSLWLTGWEI